MRGLALVVFFVLSVLASAQPFRVELWENAPIRSIGPAVTSGRVTAIDVGSDASGTIFAGTASGGVWRSMNGGIHWEPIFDDQPIIGVGALKVDPSNPDVIWVGTGEGNPRNSQTSGSGIFRSPDGGTTWKFMGLANTRAIHRICIHPSEGNVVFAGAMGSAWGANSERGVYRTNDGGKTWSKILFVNDTVGCADLVMDPQNPDKLFAAMWQYNRKPWFFESGGAGSGLHMTLDGGNNWLKLGEAQGLPGGKWGRVGVAIAASNPRKVYALIECDKTGLYMSNDGGYHWQLVTNSGVDDRPFYYHELYVDPFNEHHLIYIHSTVSESIDGGKTWTTMLPYWGVHPDHHAFWWSNRTPGYMIEGNDGGLNISYNGGKDWRFAENIPVGQFYHIHFDMDWPYHVYGGLQDNGSWKGPAYTWHEGGVVDSDWQEVLFGDGFDVVPDDSKPNSVFAMYQGGELYRIDTKTGASAYIQPSEHSVEKLRFHWNSGIASDPHRKGAIYFGSQFLHYSSDGGASWSVLSPDLTTNDTLKQRSHLSGGLTIDATSAENHCTILTVAPSYFDAAEIWVGTDDGCIQRTKDRGKTWTNLALNLPALPEGSWIPQIVCSSINNGEVFVVANNYRRNDWQPYLYHTKDGGKTWVRLVSNAQVNGHCLSIVQDTEVPSLLFLGTEHGIYVSVDYGRNWQLWNRAYPHVATQDLKIHPREADLIIGTFGRSVYIMDDIRPLRRIAREGMSILDRDLVAFDLPTAVQAVYKRAAGGRFPADGSFSGENRPRGAALKFYCRIGTDDIKEKSTESKNKKQKSNSSSEVGPAGTSANEEKKQKVKISIIGSGGDTVRWFLAEPDTGLNVVYWNFETNGKHMPSRRELDKDAPPSGNGPAVESGTYRVVYSWGKAKDSTTLQVVNDPRVEQMDEYMAASRSLHSQWLLEVEKAERSFGKLRNMRSSLDRAKVLWSNLPEVEKKEVQLISDSLMKELDKLEKVFMAPEDERGIRDESDYLMSEIYFVAELIGPTLQLPGENALRGLKSLQDSVKRAEEAVLRLQSTLWEEWKEKAKKIVVNFD